MSLKHLLLCFGLSTAAILAGCGDDDEMMENPNQGRPAPATTGAEPAQAPGQAPPSGRGQADAGAQALNLPPLPTREFQESDFTETDQNRDPFRNFSSMFAAQAKARPKVQRTVIVDRFALDELKLVGLVTRGPLRALFVDPNGVGWVTKVGDFVGKAEIVRSGGQNGQDVPINWRIDRIRDGDVVFIREDPAHPDIPPVTRVIALRTEDESNPRK